MRCVRTSRVTILPYKNRNFESGWGVRTCELNNSFLDMSLCICWHTASQERKGGFYACIAALRPCCIVVAEDTSTFRYQTLHQNVDEDEDSEAKEGWAYHRKGEGGVCAASSLYCIVMASDMSYIQIPKPKTYVWAYLDIKAHNLTWLPKSCMAYPGGGPHVPSLPFCKVS